MKLTDEMLRKAVEELDAAILAALPDPEDCNHEFSPEFERKMEQLLQAQKEAAADVDVRCQITAQEAWEKFKRHYMPVELTPSFHGKDCLGNGEHEVECQCDACDYFLECFPEYV